MTQNARAIAWMILAMAFFALGDAAIKVAAAHIPVLQAVLVVGMGSLLLFAGLARMRSEPLGAPEFFLPRVIFRNVAEAMGMIAFSSPEQSFNVARPNKVKLQAAQVTGGLDRDRAIRLKWPHHYQPR